MRLGSLEIAHRKGCEDWNEKVDNYFKEMTFDSIQAPQEHGLAMDHSMVLKIPLLSEDLDKLLSLNARFQAGSDPLISRSVLMLVMPSFVRAHDPDPILLERASVVLAECGNMLERVLRVEIRHFFNVPAFDHNMAQEQFQAEDKERKRGLSFEEMQGLCPIYVEVFKKENHHGLYSHVFAKLPNLKVISVDMLTMPLVRSLIEAGRMGNLTSLKLNTHQYSDCSAVQEMLTHTQDHLLSLHGKCFSSVLSVLENGQVAKLTELNVPQSRLESMQLLQSLNNSNRSPSLPLPSLTALTLNVDSNHQFFKNLFRFLRNHQKVTYLSLSLLECDKFTERQVVALRNEICSCIGCGGVKTLALYVTTELDQYELLKLFVGIRNLELHYITNWTGNQSPIIIDHARKKLFPVDIPRKHLWNIVPSMELVQVYHKKTLVARWNRQEGTIEKWM